MKAIIIILTTLGLLYAACEAGAQQCSAPPYASSYSTPGYSTPSYSPSYSPSYYPFTVNLAFAAFVVNDYNVRDVFVFTGPPLAIPASLTVGVPAAPAPAAAASPAPAASASPTAAADPDRLPTGLSYEGGKAAKIVVTANAQNERLLKEQALASFRAGSCASCHTAGARPKGNAALLTADGRLNEPIDWQAVLDYVSPRGKAPPACPPSGKGTPLDLAQRKPLEALAKMTAAPPAR